MSVKHVETEVKLADLREFEGNPRRHSAQQLEEIKRSLEMFGQYRPFVLAEDKTILAGNGMYRAMVDLGWKSAKAIIMKGLDESQQRKLVLADNQVALMGTTDYHAVENLLKELNDFEIPGYDSDAIRELLADTEEVLEGAMEYGVLDPETIERTKTKVSYDLAEDESDFHKLPDYNEPRPVAEPTSPAGAMGAPTSGTPSTPDDVEESQKGTAVCPACGRPW